MGLSELRQALKAVSKDAPKELAKVNKQAGDIVVAVARPRAPHGKHEGSGPIIPIANSIRASQTAGKVAILAGGKRTPHAAPYEFGGTIARAGHKGETLRLHYKTNKAAHSGRTHIKKHAYLIPAIEASRQRVMDMYLGLVDSMVKRVTHGG
jgi:hypothetical protein